MYGAMFWTIFPQEPGVSFEYHFFGALSGVVCAVALSHRDPKPVRKTYSWESADEDLEEDDPIIGDEWKIIEGEFERGASPSDNSAGKPESREFKM